MCRGEGRWCYRTIGWRGAGPAAERRQCKPAGTSTILEGGCPPGCSHGRSRGAGEALTELTRFWVDQDSGLTASAVQVERPLLEPIADELGEDTNLKSSRGMT